LYSKSTKVKRHEIINSVVSIAVSNWISNVKFVTEKTLARLYLKVIGLTQ
jgi:hypothetical protein